MNHIFAYILGCSAIILSFFVYLELSFIGFPDGYLSDWDQARQILLTIYIVISLLVGVWYIFLGWIAGRNNIGVKLRVTNLLYVAFGLLVVVADQYFSQLSGQGG